MATSWFTFVLMPHIQVGRLTQTDTKAPTPLYPGSTPGQAHQGADVYRANGCVACHSMQIGQTDVGLDIMVSKVGEGAGDIEELKDVLLRAANYLVSETGAESKSEEEAEKEANSLANGELEMISVGSGLGKKDADTVMGILKQAGDDVAASLVVRPMGADLDRWGAKRRSVALDYLHDYPVQLGNVRLGPDLFNVGSRLPDASYHYLHLYHPQSVQAKSKMPAYKYLFEEVPSESPRAVDALELPEGIPADYKPASGFVVVPTSQAKQLVSYLLNLKGGPRVFQAPMPPDPTPAKAPEETAANSQ